MHKVFLIAFGALVLAVIIGQASTALTSVYSLESAYPKDLDFGTSLENRNLDEDFESNGERIYHTGTNESGLVVGLEGGPHWIYANGGGCAGCHGNDGKGGMPIKISNVKPPDIRYDTLISGEQHLNHVPYTEEMLEVAIREGINSEGVPLDLIMPRWEMADEDVDDLIYHLKEL
ncbi:cytochrome c [Methanolobus sp. ZRKC2]|uniref:c-type cytochrome n=1 Tax=Methanolobus sp. ZRKC2 TaxID=3125783 RepID=UPI00324649F6